MDGGIGRSKSVRTGSGATDFRFVRRVAADGPRQRAVRPRHIPRNPELIPKAHLLMRAVETADAEVHDAGVEISAVARDRLGAGDGARHVLHTNVRVSWRHERVWVCRFARFDIPFSSAATVSRVLGSQTKTRSQSFHTLTRFDWLGVKICARAM